MQTAVLEAQQYIKNHGLPCLGLSAQSSVSTINCNKMSLNILVSHT